MATNLAIDDQLINTAVKLGHHINFQKNCCDRIEEDISNTTDKKRLSLFGQIEL